jgi:hypothetical protein
MLLILWISLITLSLIALFVGYYTEQDAFALVGLASLFLLSIILMTGNVTHQSCDYYTNTTTLQANVTSYTHTELCADYNIEGGYRNSAFYVGLLFAVASGFGIGLYFFNWRKRQREDQYEV